MNSRSSRAAAWHASVPPSFERPAPDGLIDADVVVYRLEEAGASLLSLPNTGFTTAMRQSSLDVVRAAVEGYGWSERQVRPATPSAEKITRMDEALAWMSLIPPDRYVLRRIVGARSLVSPTTERHLYSWRRLAGLLGADHKAIQRWHGQGVALIVAALNGPAAPAATRGSGPGALRVHRLPATMNRKKGLDQAPQKVV